MMVGLIAQRLSNRKSLGYVAPLLFAMDVTPFNLNSIAMLDAPAMTFILVAVYFALERR